MASRVAQRYWQELRQHALAEACNISRTGLSDPLPASALLRRDPRLLRRLEELAADTRTAPDRRASFLDLRGSHDEALAMLESGRDAPRPRGAGFATQLLHEIIGRHVQFAAERQRRLAEEEGRGGGAGSVRPVEVLDAATTSTEEVAERFVRPGLPCVLRGAPSVPLWTPRELNERLGSLRVPLRRCDSSSVSWARLEFAGSVPFNEYFEEHIEPALGADSSKARKRSTAPQLFDFSIWQFCADTLGEEVLMPSCFPVDLYTHCSSQVQPVSGSASPTLFLAAGGTSSGLHVDFLQTHFWMGLCHGRKRWRLVPREDLPLLYPRYLADLNPVFPMDLDEASKASAEPESDVPAARLLTVYEVILQPGDLIFVPCGWPHQVENLETTVAVSANFIDESNLAASRREAELLGMVQEDPHHLAEMLRKAEAAGLPEQLRVVAAKAVAEAGPGWKGEPLRAFKARHGETRAPYETQAMVSRAAQALALGGLVLCTAAALSVWRRVSSQPQAAPQERSGGTA